MIRWILVFVFLYCIPLIVLFRNYKNFKRACIYSSMYIVLVSTIVVTNVYMSGLNKIKEAIYYYGYVQDEHNIQTDIDPNKEKIEEDKSKEVYNNKEEEIEKSLPYNENKVEDMKETITHNNKKSIPVVSDKEIIKNFKKEIYYIETEALIPMRECIPYTKNIPKSIANLSSIKDDLIYANDKCNEVIKIYENMEIPNLSNQDYTLTLHNARDDVKKAYELRANAMKVAIKLVETKNPKYVGKVTEYLKLSDNHINNFKNRINNLNSKLENK